MADEKIVAPEIQPASANKKALKLLGIELGILLVLIIIILGILNYLNVFSLSQRNPDLFGWLPHQPFKTEKDSSKLSTSPQSTGAIVYATDEAKEDLPEFVKASLKPSFIPNSFTVVQGEGVTIRPNKFISTWKVSNNEFVADIGYREKQPENRNILIILSEEVKELNAQRATSLINTYFVSPLRGEVKCGTLTFSDEAKTTATLCENFQTQNGVKKGMGVLSKAPGSSVSSIFYCEIYSTSPFYSWSSCEPSKAQNN